MRRKENYNIYMDYLSEKKSDGSRTTTRHEKIATIKSRGLAEVTRNFYIKFYENLIRSEENNGRLLLITIY